VLSGLYKEPRPRHILQSGPGSRGDRTDRRTRTSRRHWKSSTTQPTPAPPPKARRRLGDTGRAARPSQPPRRRRRLAEGSAAGPAAFPQPRQTRRSEQPNPPASRDRHGGASSPTLQPVDTAKTRRPFYKQDFFFCDKKLRRLGTLLLSASPASHFQWMAEFFLSNDASEGTRYRVGNLAVLKNCPNLVTFWYIFWLASGTSVKMKL